MTTFNLNSINSALCDPPQTESGVDFSGKSLVLNTEKEAQPIIDAINKCPNMTYLSLTGNSLGVSAAHAIAKALEGHPELTVARLSDLFTSRKKTEVPPAVRALGDGMIAADARLRILDLSDNALGPIGVEAITRLLQSEVCSELEELRLNNVGLGIIGGKLLAAALSQKRKKLQVFIAGRNRLENDGAVALANVLMEMGTLEEIAMPQNGIYHAGIWALSMAFKRNPGLRSLNLNDNTIGPKGAEAIAHALPSLKNLKSVNFGDCLLKSKGASTLAKVFKEHSPLLESLDLSHNEIGRAACLELVDAITSLPDSGERLARVVLAGNSFGGPVNIKRMKDKLGACAELSDGEGSDNEYVTDSDEEEESETASEGSGSGNSDHGEDSDGEDVAAEIAHHYDTIVDVNDVSIDNSGDDEVSSRVQRFLKEPTIENLNRLGTSAADVIDAHLQSMQDQTEVVHAYVEAVLCVSGLSRGSEAAAAVSRALYRRMLIGKHAAYRWPLADALLAGLGLIKSERDSKIRWCLPSCYYSLATVIDEPYFPAGVRDTLRFFITTKLPTMSEPIKEEIQKHPRLHT